MMKLKGFFALMLTMALLFSSLTTAFAGTFPDITQRHSWAEKYIEDMVGRGLLRGYSDGTFKPDNAISKLEAVILSARILGVTYDKNAEFVDAASDAYKDVLAGYDIQYKTEAAYLLYWGVLKIAELPSYIGDNTKNTPMKRHEVAVLLTKVMGGEKEAQNDTMVVLDFDDDSQVPAAAKAYVNYVNNNGIMKGMEDNKFMPMTEVTRAMMATMMYRAEQAMDSDVADVHVTSVSGGSLVTPTGGIELSGDVIINIDGAMASLSAIKPGYDIRIHYQGEKIRLVEALTSRMSAEKAGVISSLANNSGTRIVSVKAPNGVTDAYTLADDCVIIVDKMETIFTSLKKDYYVKMSIKDGKVIEVNAETKDATYNGTIAKLDFSGNIPAVTLRLRDNSEVAFAIMENAAVKRNSVESEIISLAVGDSAELVVSAGMIKRITATSVNKTVDGIIEEIVISSSPSITIRVNDTSKKYNVAADTAFYVGEEQGTIYDMRLGASANISLKSDNIDKIKISHTIVPSQIIGTVTAVNSLYKVVTVDVADQATGTVKSETVVVKSNVTIIDNTTTRVNTLKGLTVGRSIIAIGALDNYGTYSVGTIIITQ